PSSQYSALSDARPAVKNKGAVSEDLRAYRFDFGLAAKEQFRILLRVVVEKFVGSGGGRRLDESRRDYLSLTRRLDRIANEDIPVFGNRLYVARVRRIIAQLAANVLDALSQCRISDEDAIPYLIEDVLLLNKLASPADQHQQHIKVF